MELFGFQITRTSGRREPDAELQTFVPPQTDDGAVELAPGGSYGTFVDLEGTAKSEAELVTRYREMSMQPECDSAVEDIVNESIIMDDQAYPVELILDDLKQPETIKKKVREEFEAILKMLDFGNRGYDIFRRWYVDGRLYHHIIIDEKQPRQGIKELRYIDPRKIRKVREPVKKKDARTGVVLYEKPNEYFLYNPKGISNSTQGVKIAVDSISHCTSGLLDSRNNMVLGYLHKAIKPLNQLRMLEDATVIYRLARAPERRIFYIDVGNLPKMKAEQYLRDMMVKHKNRLVYDASTGEVRDDRKFMTMLEDFWLPRREGGRGTEITTLPGGQNLGEMEDVDYFRRKLYKALNVPVTRMEAENQFNLGRSSEITRDELKFSKFVKRLRNKFTDLFDGLLEIQLVLKGVVSRAEWNEFKSQMYYDFLNDNHFEELKNQEIMTERLRLANEIDPLIGKYYSLRWVRKNILQMSEEEVKDIDKEIAAENESMEQPQDDEEGGPRITGPVDYSSVDNPEGNTQPATEEEFVPKKMTQEERDLISRMTEALEESSSILYDDEDVNE
jgi:hypothetical protein